MYLVNGKEQYHCNGPVTGWRSAERSPISRVERAAIYMYKRDPVRGEAIHTVAAVALLGLPACSDNNLCGARREPLLAPDGGGYPCTLTQDCPRPGGALTCPDDNPPTQECVRCEESPGTDGGVAVPSCIRVIPEVCR